MLRTLAIENYRSLRRLVLPLTQLNVITGANGTGKSSLYRALRLLADGARNGMRSPGPRRRPALHAVGGTRDYLPSHA